MCCCDNIPVIWDFIFGLEVWVGSVCVGACGGVGVRGGGEGGHCFDRSTALSDLEFT